MPDFCHLHCHTQFSLLDGAADIDAMVKKAKTDGHKAVAITDHGNMFGAFKFQSTCVKYGVKPILGCEVYIVKDRFQKDFTKGRKDKRYHQLLLAKNAKGYQNLAKICSIGFMDGYYRTFPRVDMEIIRKYSEGIIATSCCIGAMVPQTILKKGEVEAEKVMLEWLDIFGEDYYLEIQRHNIQNIDGTGYSQEDLNQILLKWSKKHNVKVIATNDSHYVEEQDWEAHDILLCLQTNSDIDSPKRFKFPNEQFFFKSKAEMGKLFHDVPFALDNTLDIVSKIDTPNLKRDILLPNYALPSGFTDQDDYLRHLSYQGARQRYGELTSEVTERLDHELKIIKSMGFPGYFLIVQDFIKAAKDLGVSVGPGRGSAAGSAVAYCTEITNIDPIHYNLLFERFLNPERVSMPDIDIDFDDEGRQKVIDYVVDKYGKNQVAQIITYGTMAARSAIRDVARVLKLPLSESDKIAKLVPEGPKVKLKSACEEVPELHEYRKNTDTLHGKTLEMAETLEGSVRHRGIHAAGVIIAPDDITNYIPVCTSKDADLLVTQFDGKVVEDAGMLKMDFLGLKTLTIIKDAIVNIHSRYKLSTIPKELIPKGKKRIDPDLIPLDDVETYKLFQRGETVGIFQFESDGMQKYLKQLKPSNIEDLIAMNALYRPGPMDYIPSFVERKHGREKVEYPHKWLEKMLKPTYGIMVYQEQIMQTAQIMADYSLGQADLLRRAMGKKKLEEMQRQKVIFRDGAVAKGVDAKNADEIFAIMEKFAQYGFNRSHSAAYSVLAFQTAYLKAHYPAEFMAAVLTHNMNDIKKVNFFLSEANRMGIKTKVPDVNESRVKFTVNKKGEIRFALAAIKGVGNAAVEALIAEREKGGSFKSLFDLVKRVNLRTVNKKSMESLAYAGAFDGFDLHRAQYFHLNPGEDQTLLEKTIKFGGSFQNSMVNAQATLFGAAIMADVKTPDVPECAAWSLIKRLNKEREVTGIYLSGHPLNDYKVEIDNFCNCTLDQITEMKDKNVKVAGIVTKAEHKLTKTGKRYGRFTIEDYFASYEMMLFNEEYLEYKHYFEEGILLFIRGKYATRWKNSTDYALNLPKKDGVILLERVREFAKKITIKVPISSITDHFIATIDRLAHQHPGNIAVNFEVFDTTNIKVNLYSKQLKLGSAPEVYAALETFSGVEYTLET